MPDLVRIFASGQGELAETVTAIPVDQAGLSAAAGPGLTPLGNFPDAARFRQGARAQLTATPALADRERFTLRVVFAPRGAVSARQNLVQITHVPTALWIEPIPGDPTNVHLGAGVQTPSGVWRTAIAETPVPIDQWCVVAIVLDDDVLGVIDETAGTLLGAAALPEAQLAAAGGTSLTIGTQPDGLSFPFTGDIAATVWSDDIPAAFDALVDDWRMSGAGIIDAKRWSLLPRFDVGAPTSSPTWDVASQSTVRRFTSADIRYSEDAGNAFEIHGAIRAEYKALINRSQLGFPVSDEIAGAQRGVRKNLFSQGAIYWSQRTGAHAVFEELYVAYESAGEAALIGAPLETEEAVAGGLCQRFARGEMYLADGATTAFEVHGAILEKFHATGGILRWGFPTTNELRVLRPAAGGALGEDAPEIGRYSRFANATIYWSPATGAHIVYGGIAQYYSTVGGPQGRLGFPTSDEADLPGAPGARYNTFEHGWVMWYADTGAVEASPLQVIVGTVATKEDEGWGRGQNDLTIDVSLVRDGTAIDGFQDVTSDHNVRVLNRPIGTYIQPEPGLTYLLRVDVHERDPEDRPRLGLWEKRLDAANGWGMRENNGILNSGNFAKITSISAGVAPPAPPEGFTVAKRHWGTQNPSTQRVSRLKYAKAFPEVDSESEWWDVADGIESIFYELVSKGLSAGGNCMGFSGEAILSEKGSSVYQLPLDRFTMADWSTGLEDQINVRHQMQMGSAAIWSVVQTFLSGNTHDPKNVFLITRALHTIGQDPVMCLAQNYDFSGAPHAVRPIEWRDTWPQWEIDVLDPNYTGSAHTIFIDAQDNTFSYSAADTYSGGAWTGGRLYFLPFQAFATTAHLPVWDAMRLILGGTIAVLGDGDAATGITTPNGDNLFLAGEPRQAPSLVGSPNGFVPLPNYAEKIDDDVRIPPRRVSGPVPERVARRMALASGVLARSRRELNSRRRAPRGAHRNLRDELDGLGVNLDELLTDGPPRARRELPAMFNRDRLRIDTAGPTIMLRDVNADWQKIVASPPGAEVPVNVAIVRTQLACLAVELPKGKRRTELIDLLRDPSLTDALLAPDLGQRLGDDLVIDIGRILKSLHGDDFVLDAVALDAHRGTIAVAHALRQYVIRHDGDVGTFIRVAGQRLRTAGNTLTVAPSDRRRVSLTVVNRIGLRGDLVRVSFSGLPCEAAAPLTLNVRPGHARWELVGDALDGPADAIVSGVIGGRRFSAAYDLTLQNSLRIQLPLATNAARLSVATTAGLFADALAVTKLAPR